MDQVNAFNEYSFDSDQYRAENPEGWNSLMPKRNSGWQPAYVEDVFQLNQYGIPANLNVTNYSNDGPPISNQQKNPYIEEINKKRVQRLRQEYNTLDSQRSQPPPLTRRYVNCLDMREHATSEPSLPLISLDTNGLHISYTFIKFMLFILIIICVCLLAKQKQNIAPGTTSIQPGNNPPIITAAV